MDWPNSAVSPFNIITPWSQESIQAGAYTSATTPVASGVYVQNQAYYYPFSIQTVATAVKMFMVTGATANGNIDLGIYDAEFNALVTLGATLQGTANLLQEGNITDTVLQAGQYWMGFSGSSATGTTFRQASVADEVAMAIAPLYMQATAHPLPTGTATPVKNTETTPLIHVMGVSFNTLI